MEEKKVILKISGKINVIIVFIEWYIVIIFYKIRYLDIKKKKVNKKWESNVNYWINEKELKYYF